MKSSYMEIRGVIIPLSRQIKKYCGLILITLVHLQKKTNSCKIVYSLKKISEPARARTEDPKIKSLLLYQLSYGLMLLNFLKPIIP
jgi:hypothetical protein